MSANDGRQVAVWKSDCAFYSGNAPFHPGERYPEYAFDECEGTPNPAYEAVRSCLYLAGLDAGRYGTSQWNPLGDVISPGETVLLKPNLVKEAHPRDPQGWMYVLTHGSVIRAVADYVWLALQGRGRVVIADAPQTDSSFDAIVKVLGLDAIRAFYQAQGLDFHLIDLRKEEWTNRDGVIVDRRKLPGDPGGNIPFNLADGSEFSGHGGAGHYYGADYDAGEVNRHHSGGAHEYLIASSAIECDVLFSLPKLKTHKKAGITVSLKNLVGINGDKNWLPHHTEGPADTGIGDEHPGGDAMHSFERGLVPLFRSLAVHVPGLGPFVARQARRIGRGVFGDTEEVVRSGNWWGNDTAWRMCLDLNKIVAYGAADGTLRAPGAQTRKRHFALVDGILAGEGRGPMNPDPVEAGIIAFGTSAPSVDAACAWLMGFDPEKIPIVRQAFKCEHYPLVEWPWNQVRITSNFTPWDAELSAIADAHTFHFQPHFGWKGHIERVTSDEEAGVVNAG